MNIWENDMIDNIGSLQLLCSKDCYDCNRWLLSEIYAVNYAIVEELMSIINSTSHVLKNINLTISNSERLGVVGYNGAWKTTFTLLLTRRYDPTEGAI